MTELTPEQKQQIASAHLDAIIQLGVDLAILNVDGYTDTEECREAAKTLLIALCSEENPFKETFISSAVELTRLGLKVDQCKSFQWDTKEQLINKINEKTAELGKYIGNNITQFIKFPDPAIREKIRKALG